MSARAIALRWALTALLLAAVSCAVRARRPDGPYREAQELVDAISNRAVACTRAHAPAGKGQIVIEAELAHPGAAPVIHDGGSAPGSEAVIACVSERAQELRCPASIPAPFARVRVPLPLVTKDVSYAFTQTPAAAP